ncbi:hypothetical protein BJA5080_07710 [Bradyrhizobium diazoefficiens SEMIA 5080]|uniref:Uncharacterized protein n=1 Tax=Bradyrhizobium diazoefficiens SEMIA 5080 TaxID=754504 RepID=A0A837CE63_9BRAD|nr:hypothetical protein BJA5080_07710 [Bradyrhizobium diazoefficiens SEMIA 5080]
MAHLHALAKLTNRASRWIAAALQKHLQISRPSGAHDRGSCLTRWGPAAASHIPWMQTFKPLAPPNPVHPLQRVRPPPCSNTERPTCVMRMWTASASG